MSDGRFSFYADYVPIRTALLDLAQFTAAACLRAEAMSAKGSEAVAFAAVVKAKVETLHDDLLRATSFPMSTSSNGLEAAFRRRLDAVFEALPMPAEVSVPEMSVEDSSLV